MKYRVVGHWDVRTQRFWYRVEVPFLRFFWTYVRGTLCLSAKEAEDSFLQMRAKQLSGEDVIKVIKYGETK